MTRYLLDTNAVSDLINRRHGVEKRALEARSRGAIVGTCELVVAELYFGVENSDTRDSNLRRLHHVLPKLKCWPLTRDASHEFGRIMAVLKREGRSIGAVDVFIAAIAITLNDCIVVSIDADLLRIPGLTVEDWRHGASAE